VADINAVDIDIKPDGQGLPPGSGNAVSGKLIYQAKCVACHGLSGELMPGKVLPAPALVSDTVFISRKLNTIGNYWPYATTIFDYIRRAMPYNSAGSLTDSEVYAVTAYLLHANKIIAKNAVINAGTLPGVVMPAKKYFYNDDRKGGPEVK
ncbi:MAG: cytochrome c, partial [Sphingobacteriaceae bacterium]